MQSHVETFTQPGGATVEVGTVTFQGKDFSALGSVIDEQSGVVVGYVKGSKLTSWNGEEIGSVRVVSSRPAIFFGHRSFMADRQYFYRATVNGKSYHGRGFGDGMLLKLRACK